MIKSLKSGFTLAEVLTTLMVIGVVAAMTIPTLLNSTDDQQSKVAFKKSMSVLSQGIQLLEAKEDECFESGGYSSGAVLAKCMHKVLNGNIGTVANGDADEITTADGMTFKFYVNNGAGKTTLATACGESFATTENDWKGGGNCGVMVDTNGRGKGTKTFPNIDFSGNGFASEAEPKDILQMSLCSKGVRPVYFGGGSNKAYKYMYGTGSNNEVVSPITGS